MMAVGVPQAPCRSLSSQIHGRKAVSINHRGAVMLSAMSNVHGSNFPSPLPALKSPTACRRFAATTTRASTAGKSILYDVPVSNNGARIRWIIYKKGLENDVEFVPPATIGGVKSPEFLAMNPQGKMPLLVLPDGTALPESQVIESYVLDKYKGHGPDLLPETPELRAVAALAARIHDLYMAPIQGCMYKPYPSPAQRAKHLADISFQLDVLEKIIVGPFVCGNEISYGDGALIPTFVFYTWILPRHFGWESVFTNRPKLEAWWTAVSKDPEAGKIIKEMQDGLQAWEDADRWEKTGVNKDLADINYNWTCDN